LQAPYNQKIIHWGKLPITYCINGKHIPKELTEAVNEAFNTWERASSVRIRFNKVSFSNADIVVTFIGKKIKDPEFGQKYVIASTTPVIQGDKLVKMEMEFNVYNLSTFGDTKTNFK
jgi:hypothetical protein